MRKTMVALFIAAVAFTGCARTAPHAPELAKGSSSVRTLFGLTLAISPAPPPPLDVVTFTVTATDDRGKPLRGAAVTVELSMPSMEMPKNEIVCAWTEPGKYSGKGRFTMSGDWRARVIARRGAERGERSFVLSVK